MHAKRAITIGTLAALMGFAGPATAEPVDDWDYARFDCLNDPWNPLDANGNRTGVDPAPGTAEWAARDENHVECTDQGNADRDAHPLGTFGGIGTLFYGEDMYRQPEDHDGVRFHFRHFSVADIPAVPSAEMYTPCSNAAGDCPNLPGGLERFDPPYPVVVVMHGVIAQDSHHRFNTQTFAENGYMAIGVDGYGTGYAFPASGPNVQRCDSAGEVIDWLASEASGELGAQADLSRVAVVGHSQGAGCARGYQGDPRVHTIIAWDGGDDIADANCTGDDPVCAPIMYQRTDGGFMDPTSYPDGYPEARDRGLPTYLAHKQRGMDVMHLTMRSTVHVDWNGYGVGLNGNRLFELASNHYNVAWLDRHLKGRLVLTGDESPTEEAAERAYRQAIAEDAFERLTSKTFLPGTVDKHNISMGFWDPDQAEAAGDPLFGGNVPYQIEGGWTLDRLSWYYRSFCSASVPDYVNGSDGSPDSPVAVRADSGEHGDMRLVGCPVVD